MRYKTLCGYIRQRWDCGDTVEIEEKHTGKYGAAGQVRQKRRKATPEEIAKHNQRKRERDVRSGTSAKGITGSPSLIPEIINPHGKK